MEMEHAVQEVVEEIDQAEAEAKEAILSVVEEKNTFYPCLGSLL